MWYCKSYYNTRYKLNKNVEESQKVTILLCYIYNRLVFKKKILQN